MGIYLGVREVMFEGFLSVWLVGFWLVGSLFFLLMFVLFCWLVAFLLLLLFWLIRSRKSPFWASNLLCNRRVTLKLAFDPCLHFPSAEVGGLHFSLPTRLGILN